MIRQYQDDYSLHVAGSEPLFGRDRVVKGLELGTPTGRTSADILTPPSQHLLPLTIVTLRLTVPSSLLSSAKAWVEPASSPDYSDPSTVAGNASLEQKRLCLNTLGSYGLGDKDCFAYAVGTRIKLTDLSYDKEGERIEVVAVAEVQACKEMLNGAGTVHGGCICYLIDNCASIPLVTLGLMRGINGVGVSQAMSVFFHAPASMYVRSSHLFIHWIKSPYYRQRYVYAHNRHEHSSRDAHNVVQIKDKTSGRPIASAILTKMQPASSAPPARL
ncbi:hypothetical protein NUW54_g10296 [Trametes sanguinea]|uniref:Uncharacterized protein n=1 Tax=Trametes sanguinea TaxID=158606 RepID=A0ACC1P1B6_9APHY|nr:hypothetical protein NUW54_g10296 [Trametes sanguinea]